MDLPPSYESGAASAQASNVGDSKEQPPSYTKNSMSMIEAATLPSDAISQQEPSSSSLWEPLAPEACPTLILDGCNIYSSSFPSRPLYILSNAVVEAGTTIYALEKVYYKQDVSTGQVKRARRPHIYDFRMDFGITTDRRILITGQRSSKYTHREVKLEPGVNDSQFKASGGADLRVGLLLSDPRSKLAWRSDAGGLLATETRGTRDANKRMVVMPRLEVVREGGLEEKDMDLLVTAWCARVWRDAVKETKAPMTWDKFKRIAQTKTSSNSVAKMGGYL